MTEETLTDEHTDDKPENKEKKKPIPRDVSGIGYITTSGTIRYCKTGVDIPLPADFKEWHMPQRLTSRSF